MNGTDPNRKLVETARRGDLAVLSWGRSGSVMIRRDGDDLNDPDGIVIDADEAGWLFRAAGPLVLIALQLHAQRERG